MIPQLLVNGVVAGGTYVLLGISFGIIFNTTRTWHIAHGGVFLIGAYVFYQTATVWELPLALAVVSSIVCAVLMGALIQHLIYRPMYRSGATHMTVMVGSLGLIIAIQAVCMLVWSSTPRVVRVGGGFLEQSFDVGGICFTGLNITLLATGLLLWFLIELFLKRSMMGKAVRAVAADPEMAELVGVNPDWVSLVCYAIGSALIAVAAIFTIMDTSMQPASGFMAFLMGVIIVIVGGVGSIRGAALAAFMIGIAENLAIWQLPSVWKATIAFGILLIFIIFRPTGLLGSKERGLR